MLCPFVLTEVTVIGAFRQGVDPRLHGRINSQFDRSPGRLSVEAAAQGIQETVWRCVNGRISQLH
jgi:hypothetical protein